MTVIPLTGLDGADAPLASPNTPPAAGAANGFARALENAFDAAGSALAKADRSEHAFAHGAGGLQEMVLDRAQADIALQIASTAASKASQALSTILGMQV